MAEQKRRPGRPATGVTPARSVRVGKVWDEAKAKAERNGETITAVIERKLHEYVKEEGTMSQSEITCRATVDVVSGQLEVRDSDGEVALGPDGFGTTWEMEPCGAEEYSMDRADQALADLGWRRVGEWQQQDAPDSEWACQVRHA